MITHENLLTPLAKPQLGMEVKFLSGDVILHTNIDGIPYALSAPQHKEEKLHQNDRVTFEGANEVYTVKKISYNKNILEAKLDKVLQLGEREIETLKAQYESWNEKNIADKLKSNYILGLDSGKTAEFVIEGKLSKNQVIRYKNYLLKITELVKLDSGLTSIIGEKIPFKTLSDIYPYKVNNNIHAWYFDRRDVLIREGMEVHKNEDDE